MKKATESSVAFAGEERFELPSMVLETTILPLNYSPEKNGQAFTCPFGYDEI